MGKGIGFGKVILFGEHFVVYGLPAIASAIDQTIIATVERTKGKGLTLDDRRKYKWKKLDQQRESAEMILKRAGIDPMENPIKLTLSGNLIAGSGLGASAASCTAIARAISGEFNLGLSEDRINELAYEGEKIFHGTPSGIDNTAATYGGLIWFVRGEPNKVERIELKHPVGLVIGNTGLFASTKVAVEMVRERREKYPEKYDKLFEKVGELAYEARKAFKAYDLEEVGKLMDKNHEVLQALGVSCKELDFLVELARGHGALGAKLTGGGLGGSMVALTPGKNLQEKVARAIEEKGLEAIKTQIG